MSHKPILTSASLYEQGAPTLARRPVAVDSDPSMNEALRRIRIIQAEQHALEAARLYTELAADARIQGDHAEAAECEASADRHLADVARSRAARTAAA